MASETAKSTPPYVAFPTFVSFVERLSQTALPTRIDRSVMQGMSGVTQSHLMSALRSLNLINDTGHVSDRLRTLVRAYGTEKWTEELGEVLIAAYGAVVNGLDLDNGTQKQLYDCFKANGNVDGETLDKCVRFYLKAMEAADMTLSPHFTMRRQGAPRRSAAKQRKASGNGAEAIKSQERNGDEVEPPTGTIGFPLHVPGKAAGMIYVPSDLSPEDCELIEAMMPVLRAYAKRAQA